MIEYLNGLIDPRQAPKIGHNFVETIMLVICAVIAGCDAWEDIADYWGDKEERFREKVELNLANGIPSYDTMERIFGMLNPKEFQRSFIESGEARLRETSAGDHQYRRENHAREHGKRAKAHSYGQFAGEQSADGIRTAGC